MSPGCAGWFGKPGPAVAGECSRHLGRTGAAVLTAGRWLGCRVGAKGAATGTCEASAQHQGSAVSSD